MQIKMRVTPEPKIVTSAKHEQKALYCQKYEMNAVYSQTSSRDESGVGQSDVFQQLLDGFPLDKSMVPRGRSFVI